MTRKINEDSNHQLSQTIVHKNGMKGINAYGRKIVEMSQAADAKHISNALMKILRPIVFKLK